MHAASSSDDPREVARADSERGELVLRQPRPGLLELRANGVYVMDTVETGTERAMATVALSCVEQPRSVLVAGLGLGHTLQAVLADPRVERCTVVEIEPALVDWMRDGVIPVGPSLLADERVRVVVADVRAVLERAPSSAYDVVLLDVDNGPGHLVHETNAHLYERPTLARLREMVRPAGAVVVWSAHESATLEARLREVFDEVQTRALRVLLQGRLDAYWLYSARVERDVPTASDRHDAQGGVMPEQPGRRDVGTTRRGVVRRGTRVRFAALAIALLALALGACSDPGTPIHSPKPSSSSSLDCGNGDLRTLTPGTLTIATDSPAYAPYFEDDDPSNGKGFESAVVYAVAGKLGYPTEAVHWVVEPFGRAYAPGPKPFDLDLNQVSITRPRERAVDFSDGYYTVNQAVVSLSDSPLADATTVADLRRARLGAQVGTTAADVIDDVVQPYPAPAVFNDTNDAKSALLAGQVDGIVVDLPTAYAITTLELHDARIVGQFPAQSSDEQYGMVLAQGSPLLACVNWALADLKASGQLKKIQDQWLSGAQAPYFRDTSTPSSTP